MPECPACGSTDHDTVDTEIEGRGSFSTNLIKDCRGCGGLFGVPTDWHGVIDA